MGLAPALENMHAVGKDSDRCISQKTNEIGTIAARPYLQFRKWTDCSQLGKNVVPK